MGETEADAGEGGTGAPPPIDESNKVRPGLTRVYERAEIRVEWYASRCIHSAACIRALPEVFDPRRRPWIDVTRSNADAIGAAVVQCPTGALRYHRMDGGPNERPEDSVRITPVRNGPNFVRGPCQITDSDGIARTETRVALCRCGQSKHMPFCDNTHRAIGFRSNP